MPVRVRDVMSAMEARYPALLAEEWDAIGLTCGDPDAVVTRILFAVDPVEVIVNEARDLRAELIVTHHPLFLRGVHSVAAVDHKGRLVHTLISEGMALFSAHTNADHARPGVSDALAAALGLADVRPLVAHPSDPSLGTGRVGVVEPGMSLGEFADRVAQALPPTAQGIRVAGDVGRRVSTVAVCGGAGDAFLADAAEQADVYVTSDLRHHRAQDHLVDGGCALIDVAHWASEWPWLPVAADALQADLAALGSTVDVHVSSIPTDPWTSHQGSTP